MRRFVSREPGIEPLVYLLYLLTGVAFQRGNDEDAVELHLSV
jgi:hypothetical protein